MNKYIPRTYGGHLERDGDSTIDGVKRGEISRQIDERLAQILGGVPKPRAPRAQVLELPQGEALGPVGVNPEEVAA